MGGSLALALRRLSPTPAIHASSLDTQALERAVRDGAIDHATPDPLEAIRDAELVVYATPVTGTVQMLREHKGAWPEHATLTDLGSVKRPVMVAALAAGIGERFVGGHPMAGDHRSGYGAARAALFAGARVWLVPAAGSSSAGEAVDAPVNRLLAFWRAVGADPRVVGAEEHDSLAAWASHLPQVAASALGMVLGGSGTSADMLGPGGRDTTRLAASPPELWADILLHNVDLLGRPLAALQEALAELREVMARGDREGLLRLLAAAQDWREGT
ncbi:MAG: prephenate dehydrogenase [Gemmatimonadetes bacterium]|nr:prephenate dehydrogenase [Gemmatimonadota bacterium]